MAKRVRLDIRVVDLKLADSRQQAQALIRAGMVLVNDTPKDKPGTQVAADAQIRIRGERLPYVSRGGLKLQAALDAFDVDPTQRICAD